MEKKDKKSSILSEMPLGLGMALSADPTATNCYEKLSAKAKQDVCSYIGNSSDKENTKEKIDNAIYSLKNGTADCLN